MRLKFKIQFTVIEVQYFVCSSKCVTYLIVLEYMIILSFLHKSHRYVDSLHLFARWRHVFVSVLLLAPFQPALG